MIRRFTSYTQKIGETGEGVAQDFLVKQGFVIIAKNVSGRYGEIDIVAKKGSMYYFFEVKTGFLQSWWNPAENMTTEKKRRFLLSVRYYCAVHHINHYECMLAIVRLSKIEKEAAKIELLSLS